MKGLKGDCCESCNAIFARRVTVNYTYRPFHIFFSVLAEGPCVARGKKIWKKWKNFKQKLNLECMSTTHFSPFSLAVWLAIGNTYKNFFFIYFFSILEHFNILWKANWTREAEKVLKIFERDVIMKVNHSLHRHYLMDKSFHRLHR